LTNYSVSDRTEGLNTGLNDSRRMPQSIPIDPSSGEIVTTNNGDMHTYENVAGTNGERKMLGTFIGADGEIRSTVIPTTVESRDIFSGISGEIIVGVISTVLAALILLWITRKG
jgi:hypothetical protein